MEDWRVRPTLIEYWPEEIDSIMAIDENGTTDLKFIKRKIIKNEEVPFDKIWFTTTGVAMDRNDFSKFRDDVMSLKNKYWDDGMYQYKDGFRRVVFHSKEIRKCEGPFKHNIIDYNRFILDLANLVYSTSFKIFSSSINKYEHVKKYTNPNHVYQLCLEFIIERYCIVLNKERKNGLLLLESRGKEEDKRLLFYLVKLLEEGNRYYSSHHFERIKGVYFNPKWCFNQNYKASFVLLELADIVSYPIHKYVRSGKKDRAFESFEHKIYNYPRVDGFGIKKFP